MWMLAHTPRAGYHQLLSVAHVGSISEQETALILQSSFLFSGTAQQRWSSSLFRRGERGVGGTNPSLRKNAFTSVTPVIWSQTGP